MEQQLNRALQMGKGILRLWPNWVPRAFCIPGKRLKLHPNDYYALGAHRGGIDERWFASTTRADNGPETPSEPWLNRRFLTRIPHRPPAGIHHESAAVVCFCSFCGGFVHF